MTLAAGEQLGPYEIISPLGKGGMGEVYRARDTRLRREVALKLLPDAAAHDADSLHRFDRETRAVATLNHPSILAIHDTGSFRAVPYAVTELLEGESLADRLRTGPLHPQKAVEVACQIADGLAAAHEKGIIHRDIKPDNIFLTHEGRAKILDFGIARIEQPARTAGLSDTISRSRSSSSQFLVGTAGYMSPEQVRGKAIDGRTDVFSLGATFFEMLTGPPRVRARQPGRDARRRAAGRSPPVPGRREDSRGHQGLRLPLPRQGSGRPLPVGARSPPRPARIPGRAASPVRRARHVPVGASLEAAADARDDEGPRRRDPVRPRPLGGLVLGARARHEPSAVGLGRALIGLPKRISETVFWAIEPYYSELATSPP